MEHVTIESVARVIQIAVAPVFLLAGIAGLLSVLSIRLGRIIDRARIVERRIPLVQRQEQKDLLQIEATSLWLRIRLINWAVRLCVGGALMVCMVIATLFIGDFVNLNFAIAIAAMFVTAMLLIISGLIFLLREVGVSTKRMRQGMEVMFEESSP